MSKSEPSKDREQQAALLFEASQLLGAPPHLKSALDALLTGILHRYSLSLCLLMTDSGDGVLRAEFSLGVSSAFAESFTVRKGEGAVGVVFASALPRQFTLP